MKTISEKEYQEMWAKRNKGEITEAEWTEFTMKVTFQIIKDNEEIMKRLKHL